MRLARLSKTVLVIGCGKDVLFYFVSTCEHIIKVNAEFESVTL